MSGVHEVTAFLGSIGLDVCVQAVVHNGFYTSMEALKGATYEELLDCGVRPMHAKLLLSNLGVKGGATGLGAAAPAPEASGAEEVASFLRSVGLEHCLEPLKAAGYSSLDALGDATMQQLVGAGLKPVHARLIASNLDSAASAGINMTPASQRAVSLDVEDTLLGGGPKKKRSMRGLTIFGFCTFMLLIVVAVVLKGGGGAGEAAGLVKPKHAHPRGDVLHAAAHHKPAGAPKLGKPVGGGLKKLGAKAGAAKPPPANSGAEAEKEEGLRRR